ncbi:hypothetical protein [Asticcacaulis sp.]|uniref:hypothetical protein n=1 Tax=Asticcacaulis sp. TaxID=1872648 RepID=UPI002D0CC064|nr:hypothetical protein [Asticcacaulis sp.]HTM82787.1 hypothetical protein [Asticcacaulis sp.]
MGEDENGVAPKQVLYPTSIRITETEKEWIDAARGDLSISDYFRSLVQVAYSVSPDMRKRRRREPVKNQAELAHALALLGQSRLFSNLAQATEHLNKGTWFPDMDTEALIRQELEEMRKLRHHLLAALGKETTP